MDINDLPNKITDRKIFMHADETEIFKNISESSDCDQMQTYTKLEKVHINGF